MAQPLTIEQAIARQEGFFLDGSRAQRNNNPGNIVFGPFAERFGGVLESALLGGDARFAHFPTAAQGWQALWTLLHEDYAGLTVTELVHKYAPSSDHNDEAAYVANLCAWCDLSPTDIPIPV